MGVVRDHAEVNAKITLGLTQASKPYPTDAEKMLWRHVRQRQLGAFRFRRQHPVGCYVIDFVCMEKRLATEVDGSQHADNLGDMERNRYLQAEGYQVLRFWDNEVLQNIEGVKERIWQALAEAKPPPP